MSRVETLLQEQAVDLKPYLEQVSRTGITLVPNLIPPDSLQVLRSFCNKLTYESLNEKDGEVHKRFLYAAGYTSQQQEVLTILGENIRQKLSKYKDDFPALETWEPNDFTVQKYDLNSHLSSHIDAPDYEGVVVVVSVQGEAFFEARNERHGEPFVAWRLKPGDGVILRAKGFDPDPDKQTGPFHLVYGAATKEDRISIGIAEDPTIFQGFQQMS
ncbi:MAG TPA: hypothetical protein VG917_05495 [Patescibacteria group bacterium]|nr:hypothetical protein [Patescibacteria group bacterium]